MNRSRIPQEATGKRRGPRVVRLVDRAKARRVARLFDRLEEVARRIPPDRLELMLTAGSDPAKRRTR